LREPTRFLECYDIAIFQGKSPTASQVSFVDGRPDKSNYRHYHLKELEEGNNDFAMMQEVASRRAKKAKLPDVFIVDGGKGQVSSFKKGLSGAASHIPVIGIAKSKTKSNFRNKGLAASEERLVIPERKDYIILPKGSALFRVITQMRDEAHRFSRRLHHHKEAGLLTKSWLDEVSGIGEKTKIKILSVEGSSLDEMRKLSTEELMNKFDLSLKIAKNIAEFLKSKK
jgi:excinuclease ABC subunit C